MEFQGTGPRAVAKRREYARLIEACWGDTDMADDLIAGLEVASPSADDLRTLAEKVREARAEIEAEEGRS